MLPNLPDSINVGGLVLKRLSYPRVRLTGSKAQWEVPNCSSLELRIDYFEDTLCKVTLGRAVKSASDLNAAADVAAVMVYELAIALAPSLAYFKSKQAKLRGKSRPTVNLNPKKSNKAV